MMYLLSTFFLILLMLILLFLKFVLFVESKKISILILCENWSKYLCVILLIFLDYVIFLVLMLFIEIIIVDIWYNFFGYNFFRFFFGSLISIKFLANIRNLCFLNFFRYFIVAYGVLVVRVRFYIFVCVLNFLMM